VATKVIADSKEKKIDRIEIGLTEEQVEALLGQGRPDVMGNACKDCPEKKIQKVYDGNPSLLWYGRFEDSIVICFADGIVCGFTRVGL
jgi:hypothetical protein